MLLTYILTGVILAAVVSLAGNKVVQLMANLAFYAVQLAFGIWIVSGNIGSTQLDFFTLDNTGTLFFGLLCVISPLVWYHSRYYLDEETSPQKRLYYALLILLCTSITCVYFSNNVAATWIFLEATTLCTAGLIYHRRTQRSLEATWKYVFVCSVGITIAYLGILLLGAIEGNTDMSYDSLAAHISSGNPLFLKLAFLFILAGYSCKMEIFPLYTIGIDANHAVPAPAAALVSTALVNAGFIAVFRVYKVMEHSEIFGWVSSVLIITGVISVLIGAVFLRRTTQYKRLLAYSTVENIGIVAIGLGVGGIGVFAALLHITGHSMLKSAMFLQMARVGKQYGNYQVRRLGGYMSHNRTGALAMLIITVLLLAFPPSPLFVSEILIFREIISDGQWWLLIILVLLICTVIYNLGRNILRLCYHTYNGATLPVKIRYGLAATIFMLVAGAAVLGLWQPVWLIDLFNSISVTL